MNWLKNLKIAKKLLLLNIFSLIFIISVGAIGYSNLKTMAEQTTVMYEEQLLPVKELNELRAQTRATEALIKEMMITQDKVAIEELKSEIKVRSDKTSELFECI